MAKSEKIFEFLLYHIYISLLILIIYKVFLFGRFKYELQH